MGELPDEAYRYVPRRGDYAANVEIYSHQLAVAMLSLSTCAELRTDSARASQPDKDEVGVSVEKIRFMI